MIFYSNILPYCLTITFETFSELKKVSMHQVYVHEEKQVHLFIAYYRRQHQEAELINSENRLYDGKYWKPISEMHRSTTLE